MRIIAGAARGTILETLEGEDTRPTLERVKENFFNAINFELPGAKVLDLFAGSGQLGLEALSRGAKEAVFVDANAKCIEIITRNAQKAKLYERCSILKYDYATYLSALKKRKDFEKFDIIFLDPPYKGNRIGCTCVLNIIQNELLCEGGLIICESGNGEQLALDLDEATAKRIKKTKVYKYGKIYITILTIGESHGE